MRYCFRCWDRVRKRIYLALTELKWKKCSLYKRSTWLGGRQQLYVFSDFKTKSEKQRVVLIILFAVEERVEQTKKMGADSQRECLRLQILGS